MFHENWFNKTKGPFGPIFPNVAKLLNCIEIMTVSIIFYGILMWKIPFRRQEIVEATFKIALITILLYDSVRYSSSAWDKWDPYWCISYS